MRIKIIRPEIMKNKLLVFILGILLLTACSTNSAGTLKQTDVRDEKVISKDSAANFVQVKYRDTPVNLSDPKFEKLDTPKSTFIQGAWYDSTNHYMLINLNGSYYHYCGVPVVTWISFKKADSFGSAYSKIFKTGDFDCRIISPPEY